MDTDPPIKPDPESPDLEDPLSLNIPINQSLVPTSPLLAGLSAAARQDETAQSFGTRQEGPNYLEQLADHTVPQTLEAGVAIGLTLVDRLKASLRTFETPDIAEWLKSIEELKGRAKPVRTVVGVVGNTGAGKSSVINSVLDEEKLLPTNCLRACTASPTEISYNYSEDPTESYRAEIEFLTVEEWIRELEVLFNDLLDGNGGILRDHTNTDSEAGVAYAKLKAVYPKKTNDMIAKGAPEAFATESAVREVLGDVKVLKYDSAKSLYGRLQDFVDSKEKIAGTKRNNQLEYWPLIKTVRIYTKADALSMGAVIVDLPGVQDSNAARAAVAEKYMKLCTGLWIVAPITRAVDDKTAKSLLGDSFKRQLKYDGTYSAVSFICSKTDDISITEATNDLNLEDEIAGLWNEAEELESLRKTLQSALQEQWNEKWKPMSQEDEIEEEECDTFEDMSKDQTRNGKKVYMPEENPRKRKRAAKPRQSRKSSDRYDSDYEDEDEDGDFDAFDSCEEGNSQSTEYRRQMTQEDIEEELAELKRKRKKALEEHRALDQKIGDTRKRLGEVGIEHEMIIARIKSCCIRGRNEYSRTSIKRDFAAGIKELDQENAAELDDTTFDPEQDLRDYDEVARSLPVFCVSSRAYQKLSGRFLRDDFQSQGFMLLEDTEIPQLQRHAKKLTEATRTINCRRFLADLAQLVNSMKLWAASDGSQSTLTGVEKQREEIHLRKHLNNLEKGLNVSVDETIQLLHRTLSEHIYRTFDSSIPLAVNGALGTASGWGTEGMRWVTYKATVRRMGAFSGACGYRDFNQELLNPIDRNLTTGWERTFQRRFPAILEEFVSKAKKHLVEFHEAAQTHAQKRHMITPGFLALSNQMVGHTRTLEGLPATLRDTINGLQRSANRQFNPVIRVIMKKAYDICVAERGAGSYGRMKTAMTNHVVIVRHTMFREATDTVKTQLEDLVHAVKEQMDGKKEAMFSAIFRDYMKILVGTNVDRHAKLSPQELAIRVDVDNVLDRCNSMFGPVLGIFDTEEPEFNGWAFGLD